MTENLKSRVSDGYPSVREERRALVRPLPIAGELLAAVQTEWNQINSSEHPITVNGLPRPWEPATVRARALREQLWDWLDAIVDWINTEYLWDPSDHIPPCWPRHPHLVCEIALLADQRQRAAGALATDALDQWVRIYLPAFTERMRARIRRYCDDGHDNGSNQAARFRFHRSEAIEARKMAYLEDLQRME